MLTTILAWLTVVGLPILLACLAAYGIYKIYEHVSNREPSSPPSALKEMKVEIPEVTHVDESEWVGEFDADCRKVVDAGTRVWRIYRSVDRIHWAECDPALTERAACNYADYIKRSNPEEFVRCDDPNGVILFYE